jgi:membrane protease YdiL (CAAX protease family)
MLTLALIALWAARAFRSTLLWALPGALAIVLATVAGLIDVRGLLAIVAFAVICVAARRLRRRVAVVVIAHAVLLAACAALYLHVVPGFDNPRLVADVMLGPDSEPYTKYLNFDKGIAALLLLGLYTPERTATDDGARHVAGFVWRFGVVTVTVLALTVAFGYARWDPKLPPWWPAWIWSMVFLTALPEEALFRGVAVTALATWMGRSRAASTIAVVTIGILFGVAHLAGGRTYVVLAAAAGIGYGWIYVSTRSLAAAAAAHAGLNTLHFLFFSYPALRAAGLAP